MNPTRRTVAILLAALSLALFSACEKKQARLDFLGESPNEARIREINEKTSLIDWADLIPKGFETNPKILQLQQQISRLEDGSDKGFELYNKMIAEFNKAPLNYEMHEAEVRFSGFIAPLEAAEREITEFVLVPYFGACIHTPPPPKNQMVLVRTKKGEGIPFHEANNSFHVAGKLKVVEKTTEFGSVGYELENFTLIH